MMIQNKMLERIQLTLSHEDLGEEPEWITVVSNKILEVKSSIESAELETKYLLEELLKIYEVLNAENYTTFRTDLQKTVMSLNKEAWDTFKMKKTNNFKSLVLRKSQRNKNSERKSDNQHRDIFKQNVYVFFQHSELLNTKI